MRLVKWANNVCDHNVPEFEIILLSRYTVFIIVRLPNATGMNLNNLRFQCIEKLRPVYPDLIS